MNRKEKVFNVENINNFKDKLLFFSKSKENVILLDSNNKKNDYEFIFSYGKISELKSFDNSLDKLDNYIKQVDDWIFGFISYDLKGEIEGFSSKNLKYFDVPNLSFFQPSTIWVFDGVELKALYFDEKELFDVWNEINKIHIGYGIKSNPNVELKGRLSREEYIKKIKNIKKRIKMGDTYELNFCFDFFNDNTKINPENTFKKLNKLTESPMSVYYKDHHLHVLSSSPERFIKRNKKTIISQPIKGTKKRGKNIDEDVFLINSLKNSIKEKSENHMIVDLVRNDFSRIAKKGSVKVTELSKINTYKNIHQMVSTIEAQIENDMFFSTILKSTFPMGSMTGAPKIKTMKIIDELEETSRGIYSGAIGYIDPNENFDFNVVIRTIIYDDKLSKISVNVGSGITFKSDPKDEYEECLTKIDALKKSLS
jgi:para-aminobenzoate synthetase component 1